MNNKIEVSIICNTYNQKDYIADALKGFVEQETTFKFEILVHDDASTDGTTEIIKEFALKYPEIIKPIYQEENKYSKDIPITETFQYPRVRGKYIAFCEGDDYWIDSNKLQKQYEAMEAHPEIDMCAHGAIFIDGFSGEIMKTYTLSEHEYIYSSKQVIKGGGGFLPTASLFYRSSLLLQKYSFTTIMSLDYVWQIHGSLRGGMLYLPDAMSVYRVNATNSWTVRTQKDYFYRLNFQKKMRKMFRTLNKDTEGLYLNAICKMYFESLFESFKLIIKYILKY